MQLSGNTVYVSEPGELLPRKNLQVLQPPVLLEGAIDPAQLARAVAAHFKAFDLVEGESEVALAFRGAASLRSSGSSGLAARFASAAATRFERKAALSHPGRRRRADAGRDPQGGMGARSEVLVIDGVALRDFDYIDLGRIRMPSFTVPVTIKSLVFSQDPRVPHRHANHHHH